MRPANVALATTGWVLLWAMLFSGVTPKLETIKNGEFYTPVAWISDVSAPRWIVQGWYIVEAAARPWVELQTGELRHGYGGVGYEKCLGWFWEGGYGVFEVEVG